jgi:hypothetical protein
MSASDTNVNSSPNSRRDFLKFSGHLAATAAAAYVIWDE